MKTTLFSFRWSAAILTIALAIGIAPGLFNFIVDPYRMHGLFDLGLEKKKIATKKHGPLYKVIEYPRLKSSYVLFGDSRSRALRDKLFHELGFGEYYNFAYSGGTIAETIDSFWYAVEQGNLKGAAIGVPLRSMDEKFSRGKNQVPEALRILANPMSYYANMFVADTGISVLEKQHPETMSRVRGLVENLLRLAPMAPGPANAEEVSVDPNFCTAVCATASQRLWSLDGLGPDRRIVTGRNIDLLLDGRTSVLPRSPIADFVTDAGSQSSKPETTEMPTVIEPKPKKDRAWEKRIEKGGRNDWKAFTYSETYYNGLKEIAEFAKANNIDLVFFIPPAHADMQTQIGKWRRNDINLEHRRRMAALGPVLDYDVPSEQTLDRKKFTDPYHFKAPIARAMAMDLMTHFDAEEKVMKKIAKRRKNTKKVADIRCPSGTDDPIAVALPGAVPAYMGRGCIMWGAQ